MKHLLWLFLCLPLVAQTTRITGNPGDPFTIPAGGGGSGTVTSVAFPTIPSWLTAVVSSPTTAASIAVTLTAAQASHQVIGTCNTGTTFAPCSLVLGDLPAGLGLTANPLSQFAATTSAQLRGVLSDESGTGLAYFQGGDAGTPSAIVLTNATSLPLASGVTGTLAAAQEPAHTGDVTNSAGSLAMTIASGVVSLAKMANLAANSFIGNNTGSPATPIALTTAQSKTLLAIACADLTNAAASCATDATNATNITSGTLPNARIVALPNANLANSATTVNSQTCTLGASCTIPLSAVNPQTATYQVLASDFSNYKIITIASGTFTITLVASGSQPANGQYITILNYGSGVVTLARSGQNINGAAANLTGTAGSSTAPTGWVVWSDGTNYFAEVIAGSGGGGSSALSAITAASGSNTIANGNNPQTWNFAQTTDSQDAFTFGETSAATGGTITNGLANQALLHASTASASTSTPLEVDQGSITGTVAFPAFQIETTWNNAGLTAEGLLFNVTDTSSNAASLLFDFRKGNTTQIKGDKSGNLTALTSVQSGSSPPACTAGTAGAWCASEGTALTNVASTAGLYPDSTSHEFMAMTNGSSSAGIMVRAQPGSINQTAKTAAITTATLCAASAGACNTAGQYAVDFDFWGSGTACSSVTAGSVTFLLTWTDENAVTHSAVAMQMMAQTGAATTAMQASFPFQTALANEGASGHAVISTNGSIIQYSTGYTSCTTGTGQYGLRATVTRLQ